MEAHKFFAVKLKSLHGNVLTYNPQGPMVVWEEDFDRIQAERDALQQRLNAVEEENDRLKAADVTMKKNQDIALDREYRRGLKSGFSLGSNNQDEKYDRIMDDLNRGIAQMLAEQVLESRS